MPLSRLDAKQRIVDGLHLLDDLGIFDDQGHLCLRTESDGSEVLINGNLSPGTAHIRDVHAFDLTDDDYPDALPGETAIHAEILRQRDDVNAVCHNHSPYAVAVSSAGLEMRAVHPTTAVQVNPVRTYEDYHDEGGMLVTTDEEAAELAEMLGEDRAIMLRGHGAVVVGETLNEAILASIRLEKNSRFLYRQALVGEPWYLPDEMVEGTVEFAYDPEKMTKSLDYFTGPARR